MKLTAKVVPFSSIVGSSVTLHNEAGATVGQLGLMGFLPPVGRVEPAEFRAISEAMAKAVAERLNGMELGSENPFVLARARYEAALRKQR